MKEPLTVEEMARIIKALPPEERRKLLQLVPELARSSLEELEAEFRCLYPDLPLDRALLAQVGTSPSLPLEQEKDELISILARRERPGGA